MYLFNGLSLWYLVGVGAEAWERVDCDGNVLQKASPEELLLVIKNLGEQAVESAAIRFINSYVNCENERYVKAVVSENSQIRVFTPSRIGPEHRE